MLLHAILLLWGSLAIADAIPCIETNIKDAPITDLEVIKEATVVKSLKCSDTEKQLEHGGKLYATIECDKGTGWQDNGVDLVGASTDLHVKCVPKACHKSLITGYDPSRMQHPLDTLTCTPTGKNLVKYTVGSDDKFTSSLKCDAATSQYWAADGVDTTVSAEAPITVDCIEKACHKSLIGGFDVGKMDYSNKELKCQKDYEALKYTDGTDETTSKLTCPPSGFWKSASGPTTLPVDAAFTVVGCDIVPCHEALITKPATAQYTPGTRGILKCNTAGERIEVDGSSYDQLECDKSNGWMDGTSTINKVATESIVATKCAKPTCTHSLTADFTFVGGELRCTGSTAAVRMLQIGTDKYASLTCNEGDANWKDGAGQDLSLLPATAELAVKCVEYCTIDKVGTIDLEYPADPAGLSVQCGTANLGLGKERKLFYGETATAKPIEGNELKCATDGKWMDGVNIITADINTPIKLECREACAQFTQQDKDTDPISKDLTNFADITGDTSGNVEIKCKNRKISGDNNAINLNGKFVFSHLKCDANKGFTDVEGITNLADAFDTVLIQCEKIPCASGGQILCIVFMSSEFKEREEYTCPTIHQPNDATDDPNFQKCADPKKDRLFDTVSQKFYDNTPPRCNPKPGDESVFNWFVHDDNTNTDVAVNTESLICVRKRCNTCNDLTLLTTDGEPFSTTDGTTTDCAKVTCPSGDDLWYVKTVGGATHEQYAGEVVCSSDKATESKWLTSDKKEIAEASCIPAADVASVKCTEAAPIIITCEQAWKDNMGCEPFVSDPLPDTGATECPNAKNMYHMQRGESGFLEGGKKIECDQTKGTWAITDANGGPVDELKRKGTVVCADSNPQPTTTPYVEATTTPYVDPCKACPQFQDIVYTCATCSKKSTDIQWSKKDDKCSVLILDGKIETEKAGEVDKLVCDKNEKIWKTENGTEVGKFAAFQAAEQPSSAMTYIVAGSVGSVIFLIIVFAVIFKVFVAKKKPEDKEEETKRKTLLEEAKKKKKQKAGDNDEILDDVVVDSPSELKL